MAHTDADTDTGGGRAVEHESRQRMAAAAEALLRSQGYAGMTLEAIAAEAKLPLERVLALFGSRLDVLAALFEQLMLAEAGPARSDGPEGEASACEQVRRLAIRARQRHGAEQRVRLRLKAAGVTEAELHHVTGEGRARHHDTQAGNLERLAEAGWLKSELDVAAAGAILQALSGAELYRRLVLECGWSAERYEGWLFETLVLALGGPRRPDRD